MQYFYVLFALMYIVNSLFGLILLVNCNIFMHFLYPLRANIKHLSMYCNTSLVQFLLDYKFVSPELHTRSPVYSSHSVSSVRLNKTFYPGILDCLEKQGIHPPLSVVD